MSTMSDRQRLEKLREELAALESKLAVEETIENSKKLCDTSVSKEDKIALLKRLAEIAGLHDVNIGQKPGRQKKTEAPGTAPTGAKRGRKPKVAAEPAAV